MDKTRFQTQVNNVPSLALFDVDQFDSCKGDLQNRVDFLISHFCLNQNKMVAVKEIIESRSILFRHATDTEANDEVHNQWDSIETKLGYTMIYVIINWQYSLEKSNQIAK